MDDAPATTVDDAPVVAPASVPLKVTDAAVAQFLTIIAAEDDPQALGLRVAVTGTKGPEYAYDLSLEERSECADDDLVYDQGDLVMIVPADSVDPSGAPRSTCRRRTARAAS